MTSVKFYFDLYEKRMGDGFYPQLKGCDACTSTVDITFELVWIQVTRLIKGFYLPLIFDDWQSVVEFNMKESKEDPRTQPSTFVQVWKQSTGDSIRGLDGDCGDNLFDYLNKHTEHEPMGIVNLNRVFIYNANTQRKQQVDTEISSEVEKAEHTIRFHTAMPYVLGGSVAKYQGMAETLKYLKKAHPEVIAIVPEKRMKEIIQNTIDDESR